MKQFLNRVGNDYPSAIFCANDEMAIGGLRALTEEGIKVPDDISIIGYDDILLAHIWFPHLLRFVSQNRNGYHGVLPSVAAIRR